MRLTAQDKKGNYGFVTEENKIATFDKETIADKVYTKLGQLEDIEDELGTDLLTLFKALKNGILIYDDGMPFNTSALKFNHLGFPSLSCKISDVEVLLKDYGRTWALTKEELE